MTLCDCNAVITFSWDCNESLERLGDPLWCSDTHPVCFSILASVLYFIRERRVSSSHRKVGKDLQRGLFLVFSVISLEDWV